MAERTDGKKGRKEDAEFGYQLLAYALKGFESIKLEYDKSVRYWIGEHKIKENDERKGNRVYNKYGEIFENRIAHLSDILPDIEFSPQSENDVWKADALNQVVRDIVLKPWRNNGEGELSVLEAAHAGTSVIKTNVDKRNGYPVFTTVKCGQLIPDPIVKRWADSRFVFHLYPLPVETIKKEFGFDVKPERHLEVFSEKDGANVIRSFEKVDDTAPSDAFELKDVKGLPLPDNSMIGMALVVELWMDDNAEERIPFDEEQARATLEELRVHKVGVDPEDNHVEAIKFFENALKNATEEEPTFVGNLMDHIQNHYQYPLREKRPKYPYGKIITMCQGNSRVDANIIKIPWRELFVPWDFFSHPKRLFGKGLGTDLFDPQDTVNHRINAITKNINNLNNGVILMRQGVINAFLKLKDNLRKISNKIGLVIPVTDVSRDFKRDHGPSLQAHHFLEVDFHLRFMETKSGHEGLTAGRLPPGSPSGVTVEQLLGESKKPINDVVKRYSLALRKMAINAVKIMSQFMDEDEIFSILETDDKEMMQQYRSIRWGELKDFVYKDINVDLVSNMGSTRARKFQEAIQLAQFGVYKPEDVLEAIDDPKKYRIMRRDNTIAQLQAALDQVMGMNKELDKELKTLRNRVQGSDGTGNTGQEVTQNLQGQ